MHHLILRFLLDVLLLCRAHRLAPSKTRGLGLIFTLHQIANEPPANFSPNAILSVSAKFLEAAIKKTLSEGYDIISLDEAVKRIKSDKGERPFAVFTFDDAYRSNLELAYPIFKKYDLPFTIFVVSDYSSQKGELWWLALEEIIAENSAIVDPFDEVTKIETLSVRQKYAAFDRLYPKFRSADQLEQRRLIRIFADEHQYNLAALVQRQIMEWDELRELNRDPLVTLGAHTKSHFAIAALATSDAEDEIMDGTAMMQQELGERPNHFAFPYGDCTSATSRDFKIVNDLGFNSAVTTRKGMICSEHKQHLTALPRVSLNGNFQKARYVELFLSGLPFYLLNGLRKQNIN